jgi:hypothetical protein
MCNKRGQLAITIIVAIVIVAIVLGVFLFPRINLLVGDVSPTSYLRNCIEDDAKEVMNVVSKQGGYSDPDNYVLYEGNKIQYLCYTSENYEPCIVQQPLLKRHIESEIKSFVEPKARQCINDLKAQYERRGYTVETTPGELNVSFIPGSLVLEFLSPITVSKDTTQEFRKFGIEIDSEMYDLILIATNIIQFESTLGDSEISLYINYYPDLVIKKDKRADEGTIYKVVNVITEEEFVFASRSLNWPQGYGFEEL